MEGVDGVQEKGVSLQDESAEGGVHVLDERPFADVAFVGEILHRRAWWRVVLYLCSLPSGIRAQCVERLTLLRASNPESGIDLEY